MTIADMQERSWQTSDSHGFHDNLDIPTKLMLIVAEAAEALEEHRDGRVAERVSASGKPEGLPSELADIVIRVGDLAGILGIDLEAAIVRKMNYNETRPHKHGKAY